ncbi:hypothetical protein F4813DRAFT_389002 [Daldinia decipiens]|uniref:uncharacterized protein n=1 Tax=Daldinia decipiens TaxID=326647 RepID=UPI0020C58A2F|nr:uncharacterized protein F4813DRAFT_389002 [Daldinia decipiens]KAI1658219.1 hypothetical protein F4813DRAFT_389002 [Daldinia decipiens]
MSRHSALSILCANNAAWESATRRIAGSTRRTFSSSARRNAGIAHFTQTSSAELDELLSTIRHKIILPAYLPTDQRKKILSPKYEKKLQSDPIIIEIDGEVLKFRYQNPFKDIPQTRRSILDAIALFETPDDFANLRPLIEGVAYARRRFDQGFYCKIVRMLGVKGRIFEAIELARMVARTGFRLDSSEKVNEVMHFVVMKAIDAAENPVEETAKALRWAEMVLELLQLKAHQPKRLKTDPVVKGELPLHRDPMVLLAPLHLAAALVSKQGDEVDEAVVDKLVKYARDVARLWPEGKNLSEVQPKALYDEIDKMGYLKEPSKFLAITAPLLRGLDIAVEVLEADNAELAAQLRSRRDVLAVEVQEARAEAAEKRREAAEEAGAEAGETRGEAVYRKLYDNAA